MISLARGELASKLLYALVPRPPTCVTQAKWTDYVCNTVAVD
jgi:hypothetical protein